MPLPQRTHSSEDYWNLPADQRAELIDGQLYDMAPPNRVHQKLIATLVHSIQAYIFQNGGSCEVYPAPFAVNLDAEDKNWVEPDISVICDKSKLTDRGCSGAPDWIIEIVSPSSRRMDYSTKNALYSDAGVREYWIIDPEKERVTTYWYDDDSAPTIFAFNQPVTVQIYGDLKIRITDLLQ